MNRASLIADARRRAHQIRGARTEEMRLALAHRICFDLVMALRDGRMKGVPEPNTGARRQLRSDARG